MEDFCDGLQFKAHTLYTCEPQSSQIMLYYDEVELCNPLGAAKKVHKVGMFIMYGYLCSHYVNVHVHVRVRIILLPAGKSLP